MIGRTVINAFTAKYSNAMPVRQTMYGTIKQDIVINAVTNVPHVRVMAQPTDAVFAEKLFVLMLKIMRQFILAKNAWIVIIQEVLRIHI